MQTIKIDFDNPGLPQRLDVVENDAQSRFFKAVLYKDGKAYTAPSGATYSIMYRGFGPQNEGWYDTINDGAGKRAACSVSGNVVTCEIARQALRVPGHVSVVLCVTGSNGYMLHGWPIDCNCRNDNYIGGTSVESFFYITQVTNADWTSAIQTWEELKNMIDPTLTLSGKAADAAKVGEAVKAESERAKGVESQLKEDLTEYEMGAYDIELDITSKGNIDASKQIQLNLNTNKVVLTNGTKGVLKFDVVAGEKYSIDGIAEHSSDTTYPTVALAFCSDETSLITQEAGSYSYDLGIDKVDNVYGYEVTVPNDATVMYVSNRGGAKVRKITKGVNPLVGKKLGVLGDSIAYGYGYGGGFGGIIADKNNMTIQNVAVSGATVSKGVHRADGTVIPSIYDQVALLDNDCDIVVFDGCFNDRGAIEDGRIQLGTMTSIGWYGTNSFDTFCHCFENLIEALVQKFHGKPILYVYHHPIERAKDTVHDSVLQILKKWSIPYVDLSDGSGGMITQIGTINHTYTVGDTVHPNELGYKTYYVPQITVKMKSMIVV